MKFLPLLLATLAALPVSSRAESNTPRQQLALRAVASAKADSADALDFAVVSGVDSKFVRVRCATGWDFSEEELARFTIVGSRTYLISKPVTLTSCRKRLAVLLQFEGAPFVLTLGDQTEANGPFTKVGLDQEATRALAN